MVKGSPRPLIGNGRDLRDQMRRSHLSDNDLESALRVDAQIDNLRTVKEARRERSGEITVLPH